MSRWKVARGKKEKTATGRGTAVGCVTAISLLLLFFVWAFWVAMSR